MADPVRTPLPVSSTRGPTKPDLHLVPDQPAERTLDDALADDARVGRGAALGAVIGFGTVISVVGITGTLAGMEPGAAFGLGGFVGFFGGGGFGSMMGAAAAAARIESSRSARHPAD